MLFNTANSKFSRFNLIGLLVFVSLLMTGCGGAGSGGGSKGGPASSYTIGGTISGLAGPVVLQDMGGDNLTIPADGKFTFAIPINNGNLYNVTVLTQPSGQTCSISSGSGIVSGNTVANVAIFCSSLKYNVGGTISGLTGSVTLQNNTGDNYTISTNGTYTFPTQVAYGSPYSVTVLTQPTGNQTCSVANATATGTMAAANVSNVTITCATSSYTVGVTVAGFNTSTPSSSLILQNNGADNLTIQTNNSFNFNTAVTYGNAYNVTVFQQPILQACTVAAASASGIVTAIVSNIAVTCGNLNGGGVQGHALSLASANVSTLAGAPTGADGTGAAARFSYPTGAVTDGINLYVSDTNNNKIRKIVIATGEVTTFAGSPNNASGAADGIGTAATFYRPRGITTDGYSLYVVDSYNHKIRKIDIATRTVSSLTGLANTAATYGNLDAAGASATFYYPSGITYLAGYLYVTDTYNCKLRKLDIYSGTVSSLTGATSAAPSCGSVDASGSTLISFSYPQGITTDGTNLYVADTSNGKIRKIAPSTTLAAATNLLVTSTTIAGGASGSADGTGTAASFNYPTDISTDGNYLYVSDTYNSKIRKINLSNNAVSSMTGMMNLSASWGAANGSGPAARFAYPQGITTDGINLYVMDSYNSTIRIVSISPVAVTTLAGSIAGTDGIGAASSMNYPRGITSDGSNLYVTDYSSNKIRKIVIATGEVSTFAGTGAWGAIDGPGVTATFNGPQGITTDGTNLYVADTYNYKIRKIVIATGLVSSFTGPTDLAAASNSGGNVGAACGYACDTGAASTTYATLTPQAITTDGTNLYVVDTSFDFITFTNRSKIRKIIIANHAVSSLTGLPNAAQVSNGGIPGGTCTWACDGAGVNATFNSPGDITTDGSSLFIVDTYNNKIRKIAPSSGNLAAMTSANAVVSSLTGFTSSPVPMSYACGGTPYVCTPPNITDGAASSATFFYPQGITTDGTNLYVSDSSSNKIRQVVISSGLTSSVTGTPNTSALAGFADGSVTTATFNSPGGITTDGGALFVIDMNTYTIRKIH